MDTINQPVQSKAGNIININNIIIVFVVVFVVFVVVIIIIIIITEKVVLFVFVYTVCFV